MGVVALEKPTGLKVAHVRRGTSAGTFGALCVLAAPWQDVTGG